MPFDLKLSVTSFVCLPMLVLAACGSNEPALPAIPDVAYDTMSEPVRAQLGQAVDAVATAPLDAWANGRLGMMYDAYRKTEAAEALYARAALLQPDTFRWQYLHARTMMRLGDDQAALTELQRALTLRPGYPAAQHAVAQLLARSGDIDGALSIYETLIERNPKFAQAHAGLGKLLLEQGNPRAAIDPLLTAVALASRYGEAHYALARAYRQTGETELAATHAALFERYRKLGPALNDSLAQEVQRLDRSEAGLLQQGLIATARGRHQEAAERFLAVAQASPDSAGPHINLIAVYGELQQYDRAEEHAQRARELDPDSVELHDNLGVLYMKQGRVADAIAAFERAVEIDPDYALPRKNLAIALQAAGENDRAIASYQSALRLEPSDRQIRYLSGKALLDSGQAQAAAETLQPLALASLNDMPSHLHAFGQALLMSGRHAEAVPVLERAQRLAQARGLSSASRIGADLSRARAGS